MLGARLALRRGALDEAVTLADEILAGRRAAGRRTAGDAHRRRSARPPPTTVRAPSSASIPRPSALDPRVAPAAWGEYLRLRGALHARNGHPADAYHDVAQSATLLDLLGERYQAALSHLALGRLVAETGARSMAERHLHDRAGHLRTARRRTRRRRHARRRTLLTKIGTGEYVISPADADDAIVRRIVDAAALPDLLGRETASALLETAAADSTVLFVQQPDNDVRVIAFAGCDADAARTLARTAQHGNPYGRGSLVLEPLGRDPEGPRFVLVASARPLGHPVAQTPAHDCGRRAAGICAVRRARSIRPAPSDCRSIRRSNRSCPGFCRRAPP